MASTPILTSFAKKKKLAPNHHTFSLLLLGFHRRRRKDKRAKYHFFKHTSVLARYKQVQKKRREGYGCVGSSTEEKKFHVDGERRSQYLMYCEESMAGQRAQASVSSWPQ